MNHLDHFFLNTTFCRRVGFIANPGIIISDISFRIRSILFGPPIAADIDIDCYLITSGQDIERLPALVIVMLWGGTNVTLMAGYYFKTSRI